MAEWLEEAEWLMNGIRVVLSTLVSAKLSFHIGPLNSSVGFLPLHTHHKPGFHTHPLLGIPVILGEMLCE